jgi:seryl-tRNA synthetase
LLNLELLRRDPDFIRQCLHRRREDSEIVDSILRLDRQRRTLVAEADRFRAARNGASKSIGEMIKAGTDAESKKNEIRLLGETIKDHERDIYELDQQLRTHMLGLPNIPADDVPDGDDGTSNVIVRQSGELPSYEFDLRPHWEIAESLNLLDLERGAKLAGARFYVFTELGVRLQRALVIWMLDTHRKQHGYTEMGLPYLVRREIMEGSGNLPKFSENLYHDEEDDLWLIPTAEVPLTGLHRNEIIAPDTLPIRYVAHTPCFRREKMAAGRDVRGIKRVHQFDKVEMYQLVAPEDSEAALEDLVRHAETICQALGIPHRVLQLCSGDLSFPSNKTFDIEMWAPASQEWLEVSSCSNCTDFQARRANIKFRRSSGSSPEFLHTLNGSGLAIPRVIIAMIETYQRADGSVLVPDVLVPYLGEEILMPIT